jgi:alkaline phosphatase D
MVDRRGFLRAAGALGAARALPAGAADRKPSFDAYPFSLGVASGYPLPDGFVLWTRLAPRPLEPGGGLAPQPLAVRWEVAEDRAFSRIVASGTENATPEWAHSAHAEVRGLQADRWYFYRFLAGEAASPVARARTAPAAGSAPASLRFAFASCQQYEQGYFGAYRHIAADDPDLVAFLGDYIYESSWGVAHVRAHEAGEPYTLEQYRARHARYRTDPDLQAAHAACPWIVTWDDHEVDNDYADDRPEDGMPREQFLARRAAAYQAYYEHMPLPSRMRPRGPEMRIHTELDWGTLARFCVLDDRQYRSWHACPRPGRRGGSNTVDIEKCPRLENPGRSMLGRAQERWLEAALAGSPARWNLLAQQTRMARFDQLPGPGRSAWTDGWDGYPAARRRLLEFVATRRVANPVVIGGDVHSFHVGDLKPDFDNAASPVVASEFVGTSITSQSWPHERQQALLPDNPHIKFADSRYRGYVRVELAPGLLRADLRAMQSVQTADAPCSTLASFVVEDGKPGPRRA